VLLSGTSVTRLPRGNCGPASGGLDWRIPQQLEPYKSLIGYVTSTARDLGLYRTYRSTPHISLAHPPASKSQSHHNNDINWETCPSKIPLKSWVVYFVFHKGSASSWKEDSTRFLWRAAKRQPWTHFPGTAIHARRGSGSQSASPIVLCPWKSALCLPSLQGHKIEFAVAAGHNI
jgi:hypothetical protein